MSNQSTITAFLQGKGLSPAAIAGIEGNLEVESPGYDPTNHTGDNGTSWGIAQWHDSRHIDLQNYAATQGKSWTDLTTQLNFLWRDLSGNYNQPGGLLSKLKSPSITPAQAAADWSQTYEVNAGGSAKRQADANQIAAGKDFSSSGGGYFGQGLVNALSAPGQAIGTIVSDAYGITPLGHVTNAAGGIVNTVKDTESATVAVGKAAVSTAAWVSDPHNWLRVAMVIGGGAAILIGTYIAFKDTGAGKLATKGAALAAI